MDTATRRSRLSHVAWPAVPDDYSALILSIHGQLAASEWWSPERMAVHQGVAVAQLLAHACRTVPYYAADPAYAGAVPPNATAPSDDGSYGGYQPGRPLDWDTWSRLPILTRAEVQEAGLGIRSQDIPADHLPVFEAATSGSSGRPLHVQTSRPFSLLFMSITYRDHLWHERDPMASIAVIRPLKAGTIPDEGVRDPMWGLPVHPIYESGPMYRIPLSIDVAAQAEWLASVDPDYLLTLPSNLIGLANHFRETGLRLPRLRDVRTIGEVVGQEVRDACREVFGVGVTDMYSAIEAGYLALQCPTGERYHVQSEVALVEILDDDGRPCRPGQTGRVIVTPLHNFATPLIRYEIGDFAEVGEPCACGRGLPVLNRIVGRRRNLLTLPSGERFWPLFTDAWRDMESVRQIQLVQHDLEHIQARIVGPRPLTAEEEATFTSRIQGLFRHPFRVTFEYLERIDRTQQLKFEDFVSLLAPPGQARGGHWSEIARRWALVGPPLRPSPADIDVYTEVATSFAAPRAVILGVTPEIYRLAWPAGADVIALDHTRAMIDAVWPAASAVNADWTDMPLEAGSRDVAFCDGGLHLLSYPAGQTALVANLARVLVPGGLVALRLFLASPDAGGETTAAVLDDLLAGRVANLNVLKLRLAMALQTDPTSGIALRAVYDALRSVAPDFAALAAAIGWDFDHLSAIESYRGSSARYSFVTLDHVRTLFCGSGGGFDLVSVRVPTYELGQRCPTVILRRRGR